MPIPGPSRRLLRRACCLLAILFSLPATGQMAARAAAVRVIAAYAVTSIYYHAWINGQVDTPPPTRVFREGTDGVAFFLGFQGSGLNDANLVARLYDQRGTLLQTLAPLFGTICKQHACMELFTQKPAFADGSYRIELLSGSARLASIGFAVGRSAPSVPVTPRAPSGYQIKAFYTITQAEENAAFKAGRDPARTATFPSGTIAVHYYIAVRGKVAHTRYQARLSIPGPGVIYTSSPAPLVASGVTVGANEQYTATTSDTLTLHPHFPDGTSRLDLLLDGKKAATTTFTVGAS